MAGKKPELAQIPSLPGVYLFRDEAGEVIYAGKAKNLRKRVRQYFNRNQVVRTAMLVAAIDSVETIVTDTEKEALLLERTMIKRFRPHFNVDLKDDKSYPYFRLTVQEQFPRLEMSRNLKKDGSLYFGPFTDVGSARKTMAFLTRAFALRRCRGKEPGGRGPGGRPCIDYQMGRCPGPCCGHISEDAYRANINELISFLKGGGRKVIFDMKKRMKSLSEELRFEEAAALRDRISAIESVLEEQKAVGDPGDDVDIIGYSSARDLTVLECLYVRSGLIMGRCEKVLKGNFEAPEAVEAFLSSHYQEAERIPPRILYPVEIDFGPAYQEFLSELAGRSVKMQQPVRGKSLRLVNLANENAHAGLRAARVRYQDYKAISEEIGKTLNLASPPESIECVDISHTAGRQAYGSVVAWRRGSLDRGSYRLFTIRDAKPGDDYGAMEEVLRRRYAGRLSEQLTVPDLLLLDGGKGQLGRGSSIVKSLGMENLAIASISKAKSARKQNPDELTDELFLPGRKNPVRPARHSRALHVLQQLRDEAHRFALTGHRRRRAKDDILSSLDGIRGVGPARRRVLMTHFRSINEIRSASVEELASLKGFNKSVAVNVKKALNNED